MSRSPSPPPSVAGSGYTSPSASSARRSEPSRPSLAPSSGSQSTLPPARTPIFGSVATEPSQPDIGARDNVQGRTSEQQSNGESSTSQIDHPLTSEDHLYGVKENPQIDAPDDVPSNVDPMDLEDSLSDPEAEDPSCRPIGSSKTLPWDKEGTEAGIEEHLLGLMDTIDNTPDLFKGKGKVKEQKQS